MGRQVSIKGIREGLLITIGDGPYDEIISQLTSEVAQKRDFFQGSRMILQAGRRPLRKYQLVEIRDQLEQHGLALWAVLTEQETTRAAARELELATRLPGSRTDLDGNALPANRSRERVPDATFSAGEDRGSLNGLLLKETLRSGRSIYHEGHVVVIGDVNPGAEIIAAGDVIVWGRLRGLVHAGATGDETAVICALEINPTQLRIASKIAIPPEERHRHQRVPEKAFIRSGEIVAEPWIRH